MTPRRSNRFVGKPCMKQIVERKNYVKDDVEDSEKEESDKAEDDMEATEGSKSFKMDTNTPDFETVQKDNKNTSPLFANSPHINKSMRRMGGSLRVVRLLLMEVRRRWLFNV